MSLFPPESWALSTDESLPAPARRDMTFHIGRGVRDDITSSTFAADVDSPVATQMHARLLSPVRSYRQGWAEMVEVAAPPAWWELLSRWCLRRGQGWAINPGGVARTQRRRYARLGLRIRHEIDRLSAHPAYDGQPVMGVEPLVLPAYRVANPDRPVDSWPLAPTPDRAVKASNWVLGEIEVGEMLPYVARVKGQLVTFWMWHSATEATPAGTDEAGPG